MNSTVRVLGEKEVMDRLGAVGKILSGRQLLGVVRSGATLVENDAKVKVPKQTGNLMRSLHTEAEMEGATASVQTGTKHPYGAYVEFGTGVFGTGPGASGKPIVIVPRFKKALFWPGAAHPVMRVVVQGMKPRPYLRPAFDEKKDAALNEMAHSARELIEKVARRG